MKLTKEQYTKWSAALTDGWKFDPQQWVIWGEKQVYTDSNEDERGNFYRATLKYYEERNGTGYLAQSTGRQLPTLVISRWNKTSTEGLYSSVQIIKETIGEPQAKKNYSVLAKLTASIDISAYFAKAAEADTGKEYNTIFDFADSSEETEDTQEAEEEPQETTNEPEEVADTEAETPAEETQETANEDAPKADTLEEEAAPDMFATFAAAYLSGKTIKSATKRAPKNEPKPAELEEEEPQEEAHEEPPRDGYEKTSDFFTGEEVSALSAGVPVAKKASYNSAVYFMAPYSESVKLIYYVDSYNERDRVNAGRDAKFWGVMIGGNLYQSASKAISAKMAEDVNRYLLEHVKSEEEAATYAENVDGYKLERINDAKERIIYGDAKQAFYERKPPELVLYYRDKDYSYDWDTLIKYLEEPQAAIKAEALRHLSENPHEVYTAYILYNRISTAYEEIKSDTNNDEHRLLKISDCIKDQKTARIELSNGHEIKVDANAVKRIKYSGGISTYDVTACDRQYLNKNEYGRYADIKAADIVTISHGGRVLYRAS